VVGHNTHSHRIPNPKPHRSQHPLRPLQRKPNRHKPTLHSNPNILLRGCSRRSLGNNRIRNRRNNSIRTSTKPRRHNDGPSRQRNWRTNRVDSRLHLHKKRQRNPNQHIHNKTIKKKHRTLRPKKKNITKQKSNRNNQQRRIRNNRIQIKL